MMFTDDQIRLSKLFVHGNLSEPLQTSTNLYKFLITSPNYHKCRKSIQMITRVASLYIHSKILELHSVSRGTVVHDTVEQVQPSRRQLTQQQVHALISLH